MIHNTLVNSCHSEVVLTIKFSSQNTLIWRDPTGVELATNLEWGIANVIYMYEPLHFDNMVDYDVKGCECVYV